jgi:hypothetical protein
MLATKPSSMEAATHVAGRITAIMQSKCNINTATQQSAVCQTGTKGIVRCPRFNFVCGNQDIVTFDCGQTVGAQNTAAVEAAQQAAAAEPPAVQAQMEAIVKKHNYASVNQYLQSTISASCNADDTASQTLNATITCEDATNVMVKALNTMDASTACTTVILASLVQEARVAVGNAAGGIKAPPLNNAAFVAVCMVGALVIGAGIALAIIFQQSAPKAVKDPLKVQILPVSSSSLSS